MYKLTSRFLFCLSVVSLSASLFAQNQGSVHDAVSRKPLSGVNIYTNAQTGIAITNDKGEYTLPAGLIAQETDTLYFSYVGYLTKKLAWKDLQRDQFVVLLTETVQSLGEVSVWAEKKLLKQFLDFETLAPMPATLSGFGATLHDGTLYVTGGDESFVKKVGANTFAIWHYSSKLYVYDVSTDSWRTEKCKLANRAYHATHYNDGKLYILGGRRFSQTKKREYLDEKIEIYDLKTKKLHVDRFSNPHQASDFASFVYDDNLIIMGGSVSESKTGNKVYSKSSHIFNLKTGYWYELPEMLSNKEAKGVLLDRSIYLLGGYRDRQLDEIEVYDLQKGAWSVGGKLEFPVSHPAVASNGSTIFVFDNNVLQAYDTATKTTKAYRIDLPLTHSRMFYNDNYLYVLGGEEADERTSDLYRICVDELKITATCNYE